MNLPRTERGELQMTTPTPKAGWYFRGLPWSHFLATKMLGPSPSSAAISVYSISNLISSGI